MSKSWVKPAAAALVILTIGCRKQSAPAATVDTPSPAVAAAVEAVVRPDLDYLGFAIRVPADADMYISGNHADDFFNSLLKPVSDFVETQNPSPEKKQEWDETIRELSGKVGDEAFAYVGRGVAGHLATAGENYRKMSAEMAGLMASSVLGTLAGEPVTPDPEQFKETVLGMMRKSLEKIGGDSKLNIPSVVMGWRPLPGKEAECLAPVASGLDGWFKNIASAKPLDFKASGGEFRGYQLEGKELFADALAEFDQKRANGELPPWLGDLQPEQVDQLVAAMKNLRFTLAAGILDGRVLIYAGDGAGGLRLAEKPAESLAGSEALVWSREFSKRRVLGMAYVSEAMQRALLPWFDSSDYWLALAEAVRPPLQDTNLIRGLLTRMADTSRELAKREPMAWSAMVFEDEGVRWESSGGWKDPAIDYQTPLRMTPAVMAANPAVRIQWVQNRGWKDLSWSQIEIAALLCDSLINELKKAGNPMSEAVPAEAFATLREELQALNRAYRDEFRAGIGDEVAFIADLQGEVPAIPGISEATVKSGTIPRFLIARPIVDRSKVTLSGKSLAETWRTLTKLATEMSGTELPVILPQSLDSDGLKTWYPPLPFIGGDFVPGVTLNDQMWMLGTSRSMAASFAKATAAPADEETGVRVEIRFSPFREWIHNLYQLNRQEIDDLADQAMVPLKQAATGDNLERMESMAGRLDRFEYRHWLDGKTPRTRIHLRLNP